MQNLDSILPGFKPSTAGQQVAPRPQWSDILFAATADVFSMMVSATITRAVVALPPVRANVTGTVGIAGAVRATLTLCCSQQAAGKIASQMLGISMEEAAEQECDAIGEICNMVAGHFKAKIGLEAECMLSVPLVILGSDYQIQSVKEGERLEVPVLYEEELLDIVLEIRK